MLLAQMCTGNLFPFRLFLTGLFFMIGTGLADLTDAHGNFLEIDGSGFFTGWMPEMLH